MSSREASISINTNKSNHTVRRIRKFKFTDLSVSYEVRRRLYEMLISFDDNVNYQFEKQQIKRALEQILEESPSEIAYVVNNVFRYVHNQDGIVTYQQFSNFCLEQHFGEVAIQRLHKNGTYSRGKERLMSMNEFFQTLKYCLAFISISPNAEVLEKIFRDIDFDKDGFISYSDYFTFLKQYFGSQSESAIYITVNKVQEDLKKAFGEVDKKKMKEEIFKEKLKKIQQQRLQKQLNFINKGQISSNTYTNTNANINTNINTNGRYSINTKPEIKKQLVDLQKKKNKGLVMTSSLKNLCSLVGKLIYQQIRLVLIQLDKKKMVEIDYETGQEYLQKVLKIERKKAEDWQSQIYYRKNCVSLEEFIKYTTEKYMCSQEQADSMNMMRIEQFVNKITKKINFLRILPLNNLLSQIFNQLGKQEISKEQYKEIIQMIVKDYEWVRQARSRIKGMFITQG